MNVTVKTAGSIWIVDAPAEDATGAVEWVWDQIQARNVFQAQVSQGGGRTGGPSYRVRINLDHVSHVSAAE
jgi:hypothetical protein